MITMEVCKPSSQSQVKDVFRISQVGCDSREMITMEVNKESSQSQVTFQLDQVQNSTSFHWEITDEPLGTWISNK